MHLNGPDLEPATAQRNSVITRERPNQLTHSRANTTIPASNPSHNPFHWTILAVSPLEEPVWRHIHPAILHIPNDFPPESCIGGSRRRPTPAYQTGPQELTTDHCKLTTALSGMLDNSPKSGRNALAIAEAARRNNIYFWPFRRRPRADPSRTRHAPAELALAHDGRHRDPAMARRRARRLEL